MQKEREAVHTRVPWRIGSDRIGSAQMKQKKKKKKKKREGNHTNKKQKEEANVPQNYKIDLFFLFNTKTMNE